MNPLNWLREKFGNVLKLQSAFDQISASAIGLGIAAVIVGLMAYILTNVGEQLPVNSAAQFAINNGTKALNTFSSWLPLLAVVFVAVLIIGIILVTLARRTA